MASRPSSRPRGLLRTLARLLRWTLWLGLLAALAIQTRILVDGGFRLPGFARDYLVRRLAAEGFTFDVETIWLAPNGNVMLVRPRLGLSGQDSPVATARAVAIHLRRRELLAGKISATRLELAELSLNLPAIASPTGAVQPLLEAGEFRLSRSPEAANWTVDQASARLLAIPAAFSGTLPSAAAAAAAPRRPAAEMARDTLRRAADLYRQLARLPLDRIRVVRVDLSPSNLELSAELPALSLSEYPLLPPRFPDVSLDEVRASLSLPLDRRTSDLGEVRFHARRLSVPAPYLLEGEEVGLRLSARGQTLGLGRTDDKTLNLALAAARFRKTDLPLPAVPLVAEANFAAADGGALDLDLSALLADAPWNARFSGTVSDRAGSLAARGELTPALLDQVRRFLPEKARPVLELADPVRIDASALIAPGAEPVRVVARAASGRAVAGKVRFDRAGAVLVYEPAARRLLADELVLAQDDSLASGSYEMDTETLAFRFLLGGRLRPMAIEGWFSGWWDRFWENFRFGPVPPSAEVDIQGVWRDPERTTVYVGASSGPMRLRELELGALHARVFVFDGGSTDLLGFHAAKDAFSAEGRVSRLVGPNHESWSRMSFDVRSDFPVDALPRLFPEEGPGLVEAFALTSPPRIHLVGDAHGPASATPGRQHYDLALSADAPLRYSGFPLDKLALRLERRDAELHLRDIRAGFANGLATGEAALSGPDADRWLAFDITLADADLDLVQTRWNEFQATRPRENQNASAPGTKTTPATAKEAKDAKSLGGRISARLAATGPLDNPLRYSGRGDAKITGADLANIRLMGPVSSLLGEIGIGFTTLKLSEADARIALDQNRLVFEDLRLTGPSALVEAKGVYALPAGLLDFQAKIRPFDQSGGILSSTANFFTSPLSSVLEVDLAGTLDDPTWTFTYGPTKLFRRLF